LIGGRPELRFKATINFKTLPEVQFRSVGFAAHYSNQAPIAISLGILRRDLESLIEISECSIKLALSGQDVSSIIQKPRIGFDGDGVA
jgi:hypothetical protein